MDLILYNTLSRKKEKFTPIGEITGLYTCGPTVYHYAHLGNLRTYVFEDILKRVLLYNNYQVKHVMNVTDVGHLTGDRDMGEDKVEQEAKKENKTAWEIADFYLDAFKNDIAKLNILEPDIWCRATDYINNQIDLIKDLEARGFTYKIADGVYFDTSKFSDYNKLSHLKLAELKEGARVEKNNDKKNPTDFALWKFSTENEKRQMEWESPWGKGFPGWHIECSAMSLHFLKDNLDIHCGGVDHINIHHTNEIAQSEAVINKPFFNYWVHGEHLNLGDGEKMAKSTGNILTLEAETTKNLIEPLSFRYLCFMTHYRKAMTYKLDALKQADAALKNLRRSVVSLLGFEEEGKIDEIFKNIFLEAVNDDLNMTQAIAVIQSLLKSTVVKPVDKLATIKDFDRVLGLNLIPELVPEEVVELINQREQARQTKNWQEADKLRQQIEDKGYIIEDGQNGPKILKK